MNSIVPVNGDTGEASLADRVTHRLNTAGHPSLRSLRVTAACDVVVLQGTVSSYYLKQLAQVVAMTVQGVSCLVNETTVNHGQRHGGERHRRFSSLGN